MEHLTGFPRFGYFQILPLYYYYYYASYILDSNPGWREGRLCCISQFSGHWVPVPDRYIYVLVYLQIPTPSLAMYWTCEDKPSWNQDTEQDVCFISWIRIFLVGSNRDLKQAALFPFSAQSGEFAKLRHPSLHIKTSSGRRASYFKRRFFYTLLKKIQTLLKLCSSWIEDINC